MMIKGLVILLLFQGAGEVLARGLSSPVPGPVIGLVLLLVSLLWRQRTDSDLQMVANGLTTHLGLLFVPAAVGVVSFLPMLKGHMLTIFSVLVISVILAMATTALVLKRRTADRPTE
ncbi:MAG: CidA/LrgA family protein [Burkholderiaceae bacterium]